MMVEKKKKGLYFVTVEWYDEYKEEDRTSYALVIAKSISGAAKKVAKDFNYISSIKAEEWISGGLVDVNCVYLPDDWDVIRKLKDENDY